MALIEVRGLTKLYRMGDSVVRALDGVDLDIERGEFVAITGPSGSGKSTIMHLLGCLDRPTGGAYRLDGRDVSDLSDRQLADTRNRQIGFVFQTFNLMNRTSALENVAVPLFYARKGNTLAPARAAIERVGLGPRAKHRSNELSGGERQRVAIARAIVNNPVLVLADEPTGNLDSRTGQQIMDVFRALNEQGVTIVLVTHEYDVAIHTRRIVQMLDGKVVSDRPVTEIQREAMAAGLQTRSASGLAAIDARAVEEPLMTARTASAAPAGDVVVAARAADQAAVAPARETADRGALALGPRRLARGANAAFVIGILACVLMLGAYVLLRAVPRPPPGFKAGDPIPPELIRGAMISLLALLGGFVAFVLGIIAIVVGRGALRRMHYEPGNWKGARRAHVGWIIGALTIVGPIALLVARLVLARLFPRGA